MASTIPYDAIKNYIVAQFPTKDVYDSDQVDDELLGGAGEEPQQGNDEFIVLEEISGEEENVGFGNPQYVCDRETGFITVHAFVPAPESSPRAREFAEEIQDSLRHKYVHENVRIIVAAPPDLGRLNEGLWTIGSVSVSYEYTHHNSVI